VRRFSSLAWRSLGSRKLRSFLTMAGVALGVAVLFASLSAGATMDAAVNKAAADEMGHADLRIEALEERGLSTATVAAIENAAGVAVAAPALERKTYESASLSQRPSLKLPPPVTVLGIDPVIEPQLHDMPLASGRLLAGTDTQSALITQTLAAQEALAIGDSISLNGTVAAGPQAYKIVGIVEGNGSVPDADGRVVFLPLSSAQTLFGVAGVTRVDLGVAAGTSVDELIGQLDVSITAEPYLLSRTDDLAAALRIEMSDFRGALLLVAAVVLFAGAFLIFNTLSMTVVEQTREVGLLRAAGTTRAQVMGLVLLQALALGVLGSLVGVCAGMGLAVLTLSWVGSSGPIELTAPAFSIGSIVMALLIGVVVTLASSLEPAWRAGRIPPVEALRRGQPGAATGAARLRWLVVVFGVLAVSALAVWPSAQTGGGSGTGPSRRARAAGRSDRLPCTVSCWSLSCWFHAFSGRSSGWQGSHSGSSATRSASPAVHSRATAAVPRLRPAHSWSGWQWSWPSGPRPRAFARSAPAGWRRRCRAASCCLRSGRSRRRIPSASSWLRHPA